MKFKDLALTELVKKNLSPSEVDCAFALVVEKSPSMGSRWNEDTSEYPESVIGSVLLLIDMCVQLVLLDRRG